MARPLQGEGPKALQQEEASMLIKDKLQQQRSCQ